ncbi:MAG: hypothetical protein KGI72_05200 [Patescibacteria group bacterium]|nr:hypothetical protein [Patescibacteria group bacterium]MDE2015889.1 hypothetical protein [Patescibacteria group bacterium]
MTDLREKIEKIMKKHIVALTKTGDKDFNPPEIVSFDTVVLNQYEATNDLLSLLHTEMMGVINGMEKKHKISGECNCMGYNQALSDVKARLTELMGGEKYG